MLNRMYAPWMVLMMATMTGVWGYTAQPVHSFEPESPLTRGVASSHPLAERAAVVRRLQAVDQPVIPAASAAMVQQHRVVLPTAVTPVPD